VVLCLLLGLHFLLGPLVRHYQLGLQHLRDQLRLVVLQDRLGHEHPVSLVLFLLDLSVPQPLLDLEDLAHLAHL
jgi:hypothetical protein